MRNIKLTIEYDGKEFNGWQRQPDRLNIQGTIEQAIKQVTGEDVDLTASGRTDAGVHAIGQVANFKTNSNIPIEKIPIAINTNLKKSIRIVKAEEVDERFHSRLSCKRKTYRYVINCSGCESAIYRNLETYIPFKLDVEKMNKAAKFLEGEHDFKAFRASGTSSKSSVRTIYSAKVIQKENDRIYIELTGNGFLYNMVRIIAGTLVEVGAGKITPEDIPNIILSKKRENAGKTLPAKGLFLLNVEYENSDIEARLFHPEDFSDIEAKPFRPEDFSDIVDRPFCSEDFQ